MITITQTELQTELKRLNANKDVLTDIEARRWAMHQRGMSYSQIMQVEGCAMSNVRDAIKRAEGKLKKAKQ